MSYPVTSTEIKLFSEELVLELKKMRDTYERSEWSQRNFELLQNFFKIRVTKPCGWAGELKLYFLGSEHGEFLWDFVAYVQGKGLLCVAESEWNTHKDELRHDFEKLFYARAPIKCFICRMEEDGQGERIVEDLQAYINGVCNHLSAGEVYIIQVTYWAEAGINRDELYWYQVPGEHSPASLPPVTFKRAD